MRLGSLRGTITIIDKRGNYNMGKFRSWESKFFKICGIMGGLLFILFGIAFVYSHGTTPQNRMLRIFGFDQVDSVNHPTLCLFRNNIGKFS